MGKESYLRITIKDYEKLKKNLSQHNFVDASDLIWKLRMIKSDEEIEKIRKITSIASKAFDELPNCIDHNQSEIEIAKKNWFVRRCDTDTPSFIPIHQL